MTTTAPRPLPAFRITTGDTIRHDNRRAVVRSVTPVVFYPRSRTSGRSVEHGVRLGLRVGTGNRPYSATITLKNVDLVSAYR